jgi:hypothetical protein
MAALCIFCSRRVNTEEHLWTKWLVNYVVQERSSKIDIEFATRPRKLFSGKYVTCRCVCKKCNGGWMSTLETGTRPILEPLIFDSSLPLDYIQQLALCLWTTKTAMVFDCVGGKAHFYSTADRQHLLTWGTPPPDSLIWIGRYENSYSLFVENHYLSNPGTENVLSEGCVTTFAMGRLVIQIFSARRGIYGEGRGGINVARKKGEWDRLLIQIWPVQQQVVRWPPPLSFGPSEEQLKEFAQRIGGER